MKVNVYETVLVDDEQRVQIANVIDDNVSKRKATRDEMKQYVWDQGSGWDSALERQYSKLSGVEGQAEPDIDEHLAQDHEPDDYEDLI